MTGPTPATARLHVERTDDPTVMRWVVHEPALAAAGDGVCAPSSESALGALAADVCDVSVLDGHVLVRTADPARWPALAPAVQRAIAADLATGAAWLIERTERRAVLAVTPEVSACPVSTAACRDCPRH